MFIKRKKVVIREKKKKPDPAYSIRKKRRLQVLRNRLERYNIFRFRLTKYVLILLTLLFLILAGIYLLNRSDLLSIKKVSISGNLTIPTNDLLAKLDKFKDKKIYTITASTIKKELQDSFKEVKEVFVYKTLPDSVVVEIVEDTPKLIVVNFAGIHLLDTNSIKIGSINYTELKLLDSEKSIYDEKGDFNADYVQEKYLSKLSEEERFDVDWAKVSDDDKKAALEELKAEVKSKLDSYLNSASDAISQSAYKDLPIMYQYDFEGTNFKKTDFDFTLNVLEALKNRQLKFIKNIWISKYTLQISLDNNKTILFSIKRELTEQFKDLDSIVFYGQFNQARIVDLRSDTYSIIR